METKKLLKSLKCRLSWMLCLVALLATCQNVWAGAGFLSENAFSATFNTSKIIKGNSTGVSTLALGSISSLELTSAWSKAWKDNGSGNICGGLMEYKIDNGSTQEILNPSIDWGIIQFSYGKTSITIPSDGASHTLKFRFKCWGSTSNTSGCDNNMYLDNGGGWYQVTFTSPGPTLYLRGDVIKWDADNDTKMSESSGTYTKTVNSLSAKTYSIKVADSSWGSDNYGYDNGTITRNFNSITLQNNKGNVSFTADRDGDYTFTFVYSSKKLTVTYPAACTDPTATQYPMTNATKTYGSVSAPTITPVSGAGTVKTVYYTGVSPTSYSKSSTLPTNAGTYKVTVDVNAGSTYCAKNSIDLTGNFVINKADQSALTFSGSTQCVGTSVTLSATGGSSGQTITYKKKSGTGTVSGSTLTTDTAGDVVVTATRPGGTNYNDVTADATFTFTPNASITSVSLDKNTAIVGETAQASAVVAETGGGTGSWKSNNTSVATINATSGAITTVAAGTATFTYSISGGCGSDSKTTGTLTVSEPACTPPTLSIPSRNASQTNYMTFNCKATNMGDCVIESWGLNAYKNSTCTGEPVATVEAATQLTTTNQSLQISKLTANTRYYVKLYAVLDGGTTITSEAREWQTKVALEAPSVADIVCDGATLSAGSKTGGSCTTTLTAARFRYSTIETDITEKKGQTAVTSVTSVGSPFSATLTGLTPNTKYYYRTEITFTAAGSGQEMQTNGSTYNFTTDAASCTAGTVPTFANVVLGQSGTAQNATFTYCGYDNFTYKLSGTNAGDFELGSATASNGTITLPVTFKPISSIGAKSATIVVKSNSTQVATMNIGATALCITPTKANYSVSGNTHTYDGTAKTAVITPNTGTYGEFTTGTATYGGQASQTNVGEYTIHYNVPAGGNYCAVEFDFTEKLTISKATLPEITGLPAGATKCASETEQLSPVCAGATSWTYSSSDEAVATVSSAGLITFEGAGDATINVTAKAPNYNDKSATVSVTTNAAPAISATPSNTTAYEVITLTSTSGSVTWSKTDAKAYFVKDQKAVDGDTVEGDSVNFKAPAKDGDYTVTAKDSNNCTSNISITIGTAQEVCN